MRKILSLFTMMMLCVAFSFGQGRIVTGKVTDAKGAPLNGASVTVQGTQTGTATDVTGSYSIKAANNAVLEFSSTGLTTQSKNSGSLSVINITLTSAASNDLGAVVVTTSLGVQRQAKQLGYSTAKVSSKELTQAKVVNLQNGLTGKVSGLNIQTVNSGVNGDTRINLRGIRSLTGNNQPMLIVDGVPINLSYLNTINPNDIADVNILKSSSSTAIYGPDGVNGAIVVTMKKGVKGDRSIITLSHTTQFEQVSFLPRLQTKFGSGSSEDPNGVGVYDPIENQTYGDPFDGSTRVIGRPDANGNYFTTAYSAKPREKYDFWDIGMTNQTDISFSADNFYLSAQKVNVKGISPGDENDRVSVSTSSSKEFGKLKASFTTRYTRSVLNVNAAALFGENTVYDNLIQTPANIPITKFRNWKTDYFSNPSNYYNEYTDNPYYIADNYRDISKSDDVFANLELNYKIAKGINATYRIGTTVTSASGKATQTAFTYSTFAKASGKGNAQNDLASGVVDQSNTASRINSEFFISGNKTVGKFGLDALVGHSFRESQSKNFSASSLTLGIPEVFNLGVRRGEAVVPESNSKTRLQRVFGKVGINYNKWIFGEVTGSYDTDSRLSNPYNAENSKISFFYPGASLSIVLTDAIPSLQTDVLKFAKIRGAISKTGNVNLGAYNLENTYSQGNGFPYGSLLGFTANNTLRRNSYEPEFVKNKEVGIELGFWNNRINVEATAYEQNNENQVITVAYSSATGFPNALLNAASFTNKGLEFDLKLTPLIKLGKFTVDVKGNYTRQTNVVNKLIDGVDELGIGNGNFIIKGQSAYTFKLTDYNRDSLGRVIVGANGLPSLNNVPKQFGKTLPTDLIGLSMNVNYKNITLSVVADYRGGNQVFHGIGNLLDFNGISYRSAQYGRQPFIFPNSSYADGNGKFVANSDRFTQTGGYNFWTATNVNRGIQSNYLTSAAFWKLREVALTYNFPQSLFNGRGVKGASFTVTGRNLLTWLPKSNQWTDPEFSNVGANQTSGPAPTTNPNAVGVNDLNNNPPTRIFGANLTLTF